MMWDPTIRSGLSSSFLFFYFSQFAPNSHQFSEYYHRAFTVTLPPQLHPLVLHTLPFHQPSSSVFITQQCFHSFYSFIHNSLKPTFCKRASFKRLITVCRILNHTHFPLPRVFFLLLFLMESPPPPLFLKGLFRLLLTLFTVVSYVFQFYPSPSRAMWNLPSIVTILLFLPHLIEWLEEGVKTKLFETSFSRYSEPPALPVQPTRQMASL